MKIKYQYFPELDIQKDINTSMKLLSREKPSWWKSITPYIKGIKNAKEFLEKIQKEKIFSGKRFSTIKRCHGMHQLFSKSVLLKWPCDVLLEIEEDGSYKWRAGNNDIHIGFHHPDQAPIHLGEKYAFIKPAFKFFYATTENCLISFIDPILYKKQPYNVCPGIIENKKNKKMELNVILLFDKGNKQQYFFKAGDPLAIMQFDKNVTSLEQSNKILDLPTTFSRNSIF